MGVGSLGKVFSYAFGLIDNKRQEGFDWLLDQVNSIREEVGARPPAVTITDYDSALRNAIARVYPDAKAQLYIFHINKNVVLQIKRKWDRQAAAQVAVAYTASQANNDNNNNGNGDGDLDEEEQAVVTRLNQLSGQDGDLGPVPETVEYSRAGLYKLWQYVLYTSTLEDFNIAWEKLKAFFSTQTAIIQYIEETYMAVVADWATCYTNNYLNFGQRTTSPVESANRYLKSFLVTGNNTVKEVVEQSFNMVAQMKVSITEARQAQKNRLRRDQCIKAY
ncbi:Protein FAR1-RELATED SEQUENCE 5 [Madurella mycetomatis]|uniref:Protein FAR1-RELATED SEQUENCE 5 n=1 Tax=Madurella mycetomatis TaxID=100816 RepID=A0A175VZZ9_9PEZI|nr:Protein FAR1-RELATED SEQUENCE 5 [Madurella mycetomatis]